MDRFGKYTMIFPLLIMANSNDSRSHVPQALKSYCADMGMDLLKLPQDFIEALKGTTLADALDYVVQQERLKQNRVVVPISSVLTQTEPVRVLEMSHVINEASVNLAIAGA